jgi:hypothetical protein
MIHRPALLAAAWLARCIVPAHAEDAPPPLTGFYAGGWGSPGAFVYTQLELTPADGGGLKATFWQPYHRTGKVEIPGLLYGGVDFVPTAQARPMFEAALGPRLHDPDVSIAVWPGASHNYYAAFSVADSEFPGLSRHVEGFYSCVTGWAAEQFGLKPKCEATKTCPK